MMMVRSWDCWLVVVGMGTVLMILLLLPSLPTAADEVVGLASDFLGASPPSSPVFASQQQEPPLLIPPIATGGLTAPPPPSSPPPGFGGGLFGIGSPPAIMQPTG